MDLNQLKKYLKVELCVLIVLNGIKRLNFVKGNIILIGTVMVKYLLALQSIFVYGGYLKNKGTDILNCTT